MRHAKTRLTVAIACALLAGSAYGADQGTPATGATSPTDATQRTAAAAADPAVHPHASQSASDQSTKGQTTGDRTANDQSTQSGAQAGSNGQVTQLSSMVVTAQSRKQRLEEVPITDHVVTEHDIHIHAATDLSKMSIFIPGLTINAASPTQPRYELRGIGTSGFGIGTDSAVGVYIDGVYSARTGSALLAFNDVKRIEVLKGPQGTLFGRNAAAGAISIITNRPSTARLSARLQMRLGNHGERYTNALVNLPAGKNMAFRFSMYDNQSNGWIRDRANGRRYGKNDDWGVRLGWLLSTANTQYWVTLDHERLNQPPRPQFGMIKLSDNTHQRPPFPPDPSTYLNPVHAPLYDDANGAGETRRYNDATLHIDHFMSWGQLTSITSWRQFNTFNRGDWDGTDHIASYLDETNIERNRSLYQEFKLQGSNDLMNWVAGVSWYKEDAHQDNQINLFTNSIDTILLNLGVPTGTPTGTLYGYFTQVLQASGIPISLLGDPWREDMQNHLRDTSSALYGDVIWHLTDRLDLTTGVRFTRDIKHFTWFNIPRQAPALDQSINALGALGILAQAGVSPAVFRQNLEFTQEVGVPVTLNHQWNDFSPRVVLTDHFTSNLMGYVSVAKGYKSGGFNSLQINSVFAPENVWNYEAGFKGVFPGAHLVLNTSVYHYRYSNLQQLTLQTQTSSGLPRYLTESSNEKATGVDFEAQWHPTQALTVNLAGAYIHSTYGHKIGVAGEDLSGAPTGVPYLSTTLGVQYVWNIGGGKLALNLEQAHRGPMRCNADSPGQGTCRISPNFDIGQSSNRTDARLGWTSIDGHWQVAAYANNVFNQRYVVRVDNTTTHVFGTPIAIVTPPRTYGLALQLKY